MMCWMCSCYTTSTAFECTVLTRERHFGAAKYVSEIPSPDVCFLILHRQVE